MDDVDIEALEAHPFWTAKHVTVIHFFIVMVVLFTFTLIATLPFQTDAKTAFINAASPWVISSLSSLAAESYLTLKLPKPDDSAQSYYRRSEASGRWGTLVNLILGLACLYIGCVWPFVVQSGGSALANHNNHNNSLSYKMQSEVITGHVTIGTHNGHFHADEALAVYMLRLLPTYKDSKLIRTRDPAVLETCHTVVDVGGEYNVSKNRYDHHQRTFDTTFPNRPTKLSSAGLIYMHFGHAIIAQYMNVSEEAPEVSVLWRKIYEDFIEAVDAHDNGISVYDPKGIAEAGLKKRFVDGGYSLGGMVSRMNPNWNDPKPPNKEEAQAEEDKKFLVASQRMGEEFVRDLEYYVRAWLPARDIVHEAYAKRLKYDSSGRIMVFEGQSVPWKDHLYTLEEQEGGEGQVLYVLYPEDQTPSAKWRIQAVPMSKDSFESRKPLPEAWRGYRDEKLDEISGVPGGVFIHASGFIGGNKTFDGAKAMALKALDM